MHLFFFFLKTLTFHDLDFYTTLKSKKKCKTISLSSPASQGQGRMTLVRSNVPTGFSYRLQKILSETGLYKKVKKKYEKYAPD